MYFTAGGFGYVYAGVLHGVQDVAMKVVKSSSEEQQNRFLREIVTLGACRSPHIVLFLGVCIQPCQTIMAMEFMAGGDLHSRLKHTDDDDLRWRGRSDAHPLFALLLKNLMSKPAELRLQINYPRESRA